MQIIPDELVLKGTRLIVDEWNGTLRVKWAMIMMRPLKVVRRGNDKWT